ncbi:hypothetical protein [Neobacillus muris]|uniref:hypothetical protein n=1 Tax=Neobacillus muris TaxID=2941334 RepID=UPI00203EAB64|nr:hypothetical protein [Neobacillus muris]
MLKKWIFILFIGVLLPIYPPAHAETKTTDFKAAFIRNNDLWIKKGNAETQITKGDYIRYPKWSYDGKWIAYQRGKEAGNGNGELWVYHLKQHKHFQIHSNAGVNFQWAPSKNMLGFLANHTLNLVTVQLPKPLRVQQLAANAGSFSWLPKGNGLLISKKANNELHSDILLLKIFLYRKPNTQHFYTIPVSKNEYYAGTSPFKWSPDHKWISFVLTPTASLSADSNTLCLLSENGRGFKRVDEMLNDQNWFQWAPSQSVIGFIKGSGREAASNKQLTVLEAAAHFNTSLTPKGFADRDFSWTNQHTIFVSRSKESKWAKLADRPLPRLFKIKLDTKEQKALTTPAKNEGDFAPNYYNKHLFWVRTDRRTAHIYLTHLDKIQEKQWIKNCNVASNFYDRWKWDEVFSLYKGD